MNKQQAAEALGVLTCLRAYRHYLDEKEHERYLSHLSALQSVIEAGEKPLSAQGMVMVPVEPTDEMHHAGYERISEYLETGTIVTCGDVYKAMIAARPRGE